MVGWIVFGVCYIIYFDFCWWGKIDSDVCVCRWVVFKECGIYGVGLGEEVYGWEEDVDVGIVGEL